MKQENHIFKEIKRPSTASLKIKGSKFISYSFNIYSKDDVKEKIADLRKKEHKARHFCFAYILKNDKSIQIVNDDGEPSSTAGKPILRQILSKDLTNVLIVVVRYFGGVKLGVSGLIKAYKSAANEVINKSGLVTKYLQEFYQINFKYTDINDVMRIIKKYNIEIVKSNLKQDCIIIFAVSKKDSKHTIDIFEKNHGLIINKLEDGTIKKTL